MAVRALRTSGLFLLLFLIQNTHTGSPPWILSARVLKFSCDTVCEYELDVEGNFEEWSVTSDVNDCEPRVQGEKIHVPNTKHYFCTRNGGVWRHQGDGLYLENGEVIQADRSMENFEQQDLLQEENDLNNIIHDDRQLEKDIYVNQDGYRQSDSDVETFYPPHHARFEKIMTNALADGIVEGPLDNHVDNYELDNKGEESEHMDNEELVKDPLDSKLEHFDNRVLVKDPLDRRVVNNEPFESNSLNKDRKPFEDKVDIIREVDSDESVDSYHRTSDSKDTSGEEIVNTSVDDSEVSDTVNDRIDVSESDDSSNLRFKRQVIDDVTTQPSVENETANVEKEEAVNEAVNATASEKKAETPVVYSKIKLKGLRIDEADKEPKVVDGLIPSVLRLTKFHLRLFGDGFTKDTRITFTHTPQEFNTRCDHLLDDQDFGVHNGEVDEESALFVLEAPPPTTDYKFYICVKNSTHDTSYTHQGSEKWKILATHNKLLPLWASLILIVILLMLASLFSGLNLGLMALDRTELKIIANTGTEKERKYARAIMPVRSHGNYLLCTILLSNVAVNSTFTVILDDLTSGLVAVIGSTLAIVFIAEITPQAICARHGLFIGAKSIWIMKIVMGICAPLAWPTSKLLDYFLGEEIGTHYNRERLKELVKITNHVNDLDKEEVNIISGALDLRKKMVKDIMTKLKDCFMLPIESVLDFETMSEIVKSGYSRIPVYEGHRGNIVTVLFIKDLAFVDPDDNTPLRTLCQYYQNPCNFVFEDITLDVMLKQFKEGHKGHMAFVQRIDREGEGDPIYETVGLVTLEDVIEEMIQAEIVDETDVFSDNRTKKRLARPLNKFKDLAAFAGHQHQRVHVSPQLVLATFQFLSASVDAFRPEMISETVLRRLLKQDVIQHIKLRGDEDKNDPKRYVFQEGKPVDYFVLILEGRVEVTVGRENLVFEAGPFTYFGVQALTQNVGLAEAPAPSNLGSLQNLNMDSMLRHTFVPDYSVRAIAELYYLTIKRSMYLAAKRATLMEKGALNKGNTNEQIEPEVDKLLSDGNEDREEPRQQVVPASASPVTNATFKSKEKDEPANPEEEKLLK